MWLLVLSYLLARGRQIMPMLAERVLSHASVIMVTTPSRSVEVGFRGQATLGLELPERHIFGRSHWSLSTTSLGRVGKRAAALRFSK